MRSKAASDPTLKRRLSAILALCAMAAPAAAAEPPLCVANPVTITAAFQTDKDNDGLSGIACQPEDAAGTDSRHCLVVDDELQSAQFADLTEMASHPVFAPGKPIALLHGNAAPDSVLGAAPVNSNCEPNAKYKEFDGEAVAWASNTYYVIGSHGCGRNNGKFSPSSMFLARFLADTEPASIEFTYRVSDALLATAKIRDYFNRKLEKKTPAEAEPKGLNVEGMAIEGDALFIGLRAPEIDGKGFIVKSSISALFAPGPDKLLGQPKEPIEIPVSAGAGIRDLSPLSPNELLVLTGPGPNCEKPDCSHYAIQRLDLAKPNDMRTLCTMTTPAGEKPEGIFVLNYDAQKGIDVILTYDGRPARPDGGAVELYRLRAD